MNLATRSIRSAAFLSLSTILNIIIGFIGGIALARLLNPNDFGTFALAVTINAFLDVRSRFLMEQKFLGNQAQQTSPYLDTFLTLGLGLNGLSFLIISIIAIGMISLNRSDLALSLIILGSLNLFTPISDAIRLSIEKEVAFKAISIIQFSSSLAQFTTNFIGAVAGLGWWSLLLGQAMGIFINLGLFLWIAPRRPRLYFNYTIARDFIIYGLKYGVVTVSSGVLLGQFDNLIIGLLAGTQALGFYDRAYRTAQWPTLLVSAALGRISLPTYSKLQDNPLQLGKAFSMVLWVVLTLTAPISLCFLVTAPTLVPLLYGKQWIPVIPVLQILAAFATFRPLLDDTVSILVATHKQYQLSWLLFSQAVTLIILAPPLTWGFGATGTAFSVGITFLISATFLLYFGHTYLKINVWQAAGLPIANSLLTLAFYFVITYTLHLENFNLPLRLMIEVVTWFSLYGLISLVTSYKIIMGNARYILKTAQG